MVLVDDLVPLDCESESRVVFVLGGESTRDMGAVSDLWYAGFTIKLFKLRVGSHSGDK